MIACIAHVTGGEGGIRTHGDLTATTVFETVPFDHSGTSPLVYDSFDSAACTTRAAVAVATGKTAWRSLAFACRHPKIGEKSP